MQPTKRLLAQAAARHLQQVMPDATITGVTIHAEYRGHAVSVPVMDPAGLTFAAAVGVMQPEPIPPPLADRILETLTQATKPLTADAMARRCGVKNGGHFRGAVSQLVKSNRIHKVRAGYVLSAQETKPAPEGDSEAA